MLGFLLGVIYCFVTFLYIEYILYFCVMPFVMFHELYKQNVSLYVVAIKRELKHCCLCLLIPEEVVDHHQRR